MTLAVEQDKRYKNMRQKCTSSHLGNIISRRPAGWEIIKPIPCVRECVCHILKRAVHHTGCFSLAFSMFYDLIAYAFSFDALFFRPRSVAK